MSELKKKSLIALAWDWSAKLYSQLVGLVVTIVLARIVTPAEFGTVALVMAIVGFSQIFCDAGLARALVQRSKLLPIHYSSVFLFNLSVAAILSAVVFLAADQIGVFFNNPSLAAVAEALSCLFLFNSLGSVHAARLTRDLKYDILAKARFLAASCAGLVGIGLALKGAGIWSLVAHAIVFALFKSLVLWLRSGWAPTLEFSRKALGQLWGFGFRMFLSGLIDQTFERIDMIVIGRLFSPATLGFYDRAKSINSLLVRYSSSSLTAVLFPVLSSVKNDVARANNIVMSLLGLLSLYTFFVLGLVYLLSAEIILILFSSKWVDSVPYLQLLVLGGFGAPLGALLLNVLRSKGKSREYLRLEIYKKSFRALCMVVGFAWGIEGYLYGMIVAAIAGTYLNVFFASVQMNTGQWVLFRPILTQFVIVALCVPIVLGMNQALQLSLLAGLAAKTLVFTVLFLGLNHVFRTSSYLGLREQLSAATGGR